MCNHPGLDSSGPDTAGEGAADPPVTEPNAHSILIAILKQVGLDSGLVDEEPGDPDAIFVGEAKYDPVLIVNGTVDVSLKPGENDLEELVITTDQRRRAAYPTEEVVIHVASIDELVAHAVTAVHAIRLTLASPSGGGNQRR